MIIAESFADIVHLDGDGAPYFSISHLMNHPSCSGGTLKIALYRRGWEAIFRLEDNGCGMNEETMRRMFDKFYQGDPSRSKAGNGLGLTIVKRIIDLCGGAIVVDSELGQGSVFTIQLPLGMEAHSEGK